MADFTKAQLGTLLTGPTGSSFGYESQTAQYGALLKGSTATPFGTSVAASSFADRYDDFTSVPSGSLGSSYTATNGVTYPLNSSNPISTNVDYPGNLGGGGDLGGGDAAVEQVPDMTGRPRVEIKLPVENDPANLNNDPTADGNGDQAGKPESNAAKQQEGGANCSRPADTNSGQEKPQQEKPKKEDGEEPKEPEKTPVEDDPNAEPSPLDDADWPQGPNNKPAQTGDELTDATAKLESNNSPIDGPSGAYQNYRYQQFKPFVQQYGAGAAGVQNYANQVYNANPNATFGDFYGGYVTGTGNPANANINSLLTTTQPGAQGAYQNLMRNSPISPGTPLRTLLRR
jgi:hypothetical protein